MLPSARFDRTVSPTPVTGGTTAKQGSRPQGGVSHDDQLKASASHVSTHSLSTASLYGVWVLLATLLALAMVSSLIGTPFDLTCRSTIEHAPQKAQEIGIPAPIVSTARRPVM